MISRLTTSLLLWIFLVLTVVFLETSAASEKVLLRDVSAITLHKGKMTTGRRVSPTMQLKCVGGSAKGAFTPKVVQCANQGFDGSDVQWRCDADLPHDMEFGAISVSCEGYDYANDPYILKGSCGLEYELEYTSGSGGNRSMSRKSSEDRWDQFATFVVVAFIAYIIYAMWTNRNQNPENDGYRAGGPGGPGGPGSGGGGPGGYPSAPPPPYDENNYGKPPPYGFRGDSSGGCSGSSSGGASGSGAAGNNGGGSFWTGASLGAIGGYLASSFLNNNAGGYARPRYNNRFFEDTGFGSSSSSWGSPSTSTRSSSGYGGTTRR